MIKMESIHDSIRAQNRQKSLADPRYKKGKGGGG